MQWLHPGAFGESTAQGPAAVAFPLMCVPRPQQPPGERTEPCSPSTSTLVRAPVPRKLQVSGSVREARRELLNRRIPMPRPLSVRTTLPWLHIPRPVVALPPWLPPGFADWCLVPLPILQCAASLFPSAWYIRNTCLLKHLGRYCFF